MQVLCQYGPRKSKPKVKRNYANSNKLWHFLAAIIWHTFFGKYKNLYVSVLFLRCFILYLRAISKNKPPGAYIWRGSLTEGFLCYKFEGLIFGGAYTWRGFFPEFYGILRQYHRRTFVIKCLSNYSGKQSRDRKTYSNKY